MSSRAEIISSLRECLNKIVKKDFSSVNTDESLHLDSINRISLIVELEWVYDVEIDSGELEADVFETLDSLAELIEKLVGERV